MKGKSPLFSKSVEKSSDQSNSEKFDIAAFPISASSNKYDSYLLEENHITGGSKAKFLKEVLGYNKGDGGLLHEAIRQAIKNSKPTRIKESPYGTVREYTIRLAGKNKTAGANVVVVIQKDNGSSIWRTITVYPNKKDK